MPIMNRIVVVVALALLASLWCARAEGPDDQYVRIYNIIQQGDTLESAGQADQALARYLEAQGALQRFKKGYPEWNPNVVVFRLNYLNSKVTALSAKVPPQPQRPAPVPPNPPAANPANPTANAVQPAK